MAVKYKVPKIESFDVDGVYGKMEVLVDSDGDLKFVPEYEPTLWVSKDDIDAFVKALKALTGVE